MIDLDMRCLREPDQFEPNVDPIGLAIQTPFHFGMDRACVSVCRYRQPMKVRPKWLRLNDFQTGRAGFSAAVFDDIFEKLLRFCCREIDSLRHAL